MKNRIPFLDSEIDIASTKEASDRTIKYLNEENSKVVYFLNSDTLVQLKNSEDWKIMLKESDLILPGTSSMNRHINDVLGRKRDPFFVEGYFDCIFDYAIQEGFEIVLVTLDEEHMHTIQENIHEKRPYLNLTGVLLEKDETSLDHIVNGINSVAPDILLVALDEKNQLDLLYTFRDQMNAGLMLFTGNALYDKAILEAEVPNSIDKLRITNFYRWMMGDKKMKTMFNNLKIKRELKQHNRDE